MSSTTESHEMDYMINVYKQAGTDDYNYDTALRNLWTIEGICHVNEDTLFNLDEDQRTKYQRQSHDIKQMIEILVDGKTRQKYDAKLAEQKQNNKIKSVKKYTPYQTSDINLRKYNEQIHELIEMNHAVSDACITSCYKQSHNKVCKSLHYNGIMKIH